MTEGVTEDHGQLMAEITVLRITSLLCALT